MEANHSLQILAFAQARQILGFSEKTISVSPEKTPRTVLSEISPQFITQNPSFRVALDEEYASWDDLIQKSQVLAIIPPVSGG